MTTRTDKLASVIQHAVQDVLARGINDPRVRGLVSVTKVEVLPDLSEARVLVSVLPAEQAALTMHGLTHAAGHIQKQIAGEITAKRMPRLSFRLDDSLKKAAALHAAIEEDKGQEVDKSTSQHVPELKH